MKKTEVITVVLMMLLTGIIFLFFEYGSQAKLAAIGFIAFIALLITMRILPKDITDIFLRDKNDIIALLPEDQKKIIEILSEERGFLSFKKKCIYNNRVLVIKSKKKTVELFYCKSDDCEDFIVVDDGRYSFRMESEKMMLYKQILGIR